MAQKILFVAAMPEEMEPLRALAAQTETQTETRSPREFVFETIGIGMVQAASTLVEALHKHRPTAIICIGSAGGLARDSRVGQVVVGTKYVNTGADGTAFGYEPGQVPRQPAFWPADPGLLAAAQEAAKAPECAELSIRFGQMNSSDAFVTERNVGSVREVFPQGLTADMESQALAQVAGTRQIPFIAVRGISDLCGDPDDQSVSFHAEVGEVARSAGRVALALAERFV